MRLGGAGDHRPLPRAAAGQVVDAAGHLADAAGDTVVGDYHALAATGNEFIGDYAARDEHDQAFGDAKDAASASWDQAGQNLSDAGTDIVGQ